jgi:hypothetical protein
VCAQLRLATTSAILAVESGFIEQRLQTACSALEMLPWVTEVLEGGMDEAKCGYKHDSAWRIPRLLTSAAVDTAFDRHTDDRLAQFEKAENEGDVRPHSHRYNTG